MSASAELAWAVGTMGLLGLVLLVTSAAIQRRHAAVAALRFARLFKEVEAARAAAEGARSEAIESRRSAESSERILDDRFGPRR